MHPLSHQLPRDTKWPGNATLARAAWPEPATKSHSQSGLIREQSAGDQRAGSELHTIGPLWLADLGFLHERRPPSCLTTWEPTGRQNRGDKETHALTAAALFLEMGRLSYEAATLSRCRGPWSHLSPSIQSTKVPIPSGAAQSSTMAMQKAVLGQEL